MISEQLSIGTIYDISAVADRCIVNRTTQNTSIRAPKSDCKKGI